MAEIWLIQNAAVANSAPNAGVVTSATKFTMLQVKMGSTLVTPRAKVIAWSVSFNATTAIAPFACDLIACGTAATVTAAAAADIMNYDPLAVAVTDGFPFQLSTTTTGFTSSGAADATTPTGTRVFDSQLIAPTNQYVYEFPLGREPSFKVAEYLRLRVTGDGTTKCVAWVKIEI